MTLGDLLSELRENVLHDRSSQIDGDSDKLWSDTTLIRYLNLAQERFVRKTCCLTSKRYIQTVGYQRDYPLDDTVIAIKSMRFMGNASWVNGVFTPGSFAAGTIANGVYTPGAFTPNLQLPIVYPDDADLGRTGHAQMQSYPTPGMACFDIRTLSERGPGKPLAFSTDEQTDVDVDGTGGLISVRLYPLVDPRWGACNVEIRACVLPAELTVDNLDAVPQIPSLYHMLLVDYAAGRALSIVDHDLGDPQRAAEMMGKFEAETEEARQEAQRKAFAPMVWGFGRNGFGGYMGNI